VIFEILICWFYFKRPLKRNIRLGQLFHCELLRLLRRFEYRCHCHFPRHRQGHCLCHTAHHLLGLPGLQTLQDEQRWLLTLALLVCRRLVEQLADTVWEVRGGSCPSGKQNLLDDTYSKAKCQPWTLLFLASQFSVKRTCHAELPILSWSALG